MLGAITQLSTPPSLMKFFVRHDCSKLNIEKQQVVFTSYKKDSKLPAKQIFKLCESKAEKVLPFGYGYLPLLNRPAHSKATLDDRSFSFASSSVWNSIQNDVRCAPSLSSFKSRLKTYLFRSVYKD